MSGVPSQSRLPESQFAALQAALRPTQRRQALRAHAIACASWFLLALSGACHRDANANLDRGDRLLALGENKQAIVEYQSALNVEPSAHAQRGLGLAYEALSAFAEAERHLQAALEAKPGDLDARVALARVQTRFGQYEKARQQLLTALEQEPNHDPALLLLGVYAETRPQIQQAVDFVEARSERLQKLGHSPSLESQLVLADLMARLNRGDSADKLRENVRYLSLGNPRLTLDLAQASADRANNELARALLRPLVESLPSNGAPWQTDAWQTLASAAIELGQPAEARAAVKHLNARAKDPEFRLLDARLALASGMQAESTQKLLTLLQDLPEDQRHERSRVREILARALLGQRQYDAAEAQLKALLEEDPQQVDASLTLARLHMSRGAPDKAVQVLSALTDNHGRLARAHATLGEAELQAGRLDLAEQAFRRLWELAPQEPDARYWLSVTLRKRGQSEQARRLLEGNLKRFPTHTGSLRELLEILEQSSGTNAAKAYAISYGDQHPDSPAVASLQGDWLLEHRDAEHALAAYRRALNTNPAFLPATSALSRFYARHGRGSLAQSVVDAALASDSQDLQSFLLAASIAGELHRPEQARQYCERALELHPGHPLVLAALAIIQAEAFRELPRAKQLAERAFAAAPNEPDVLDSFGWVTHLAGDPAGSLRYLEAASQAVPTSASFSYHWGAALLAAGQSAAASEKLGQVLKLDPQFPTAREIREALARR
jgi:tetratricopeptide (TPR) repeat protein